jgi:hypothetical protein
VLDEQQLRTLVEGFKGSLLFPIVAVAAFTGARRNEVLALRWSDLDVENKTLRIERAVEQTDKYGLTLKEPKTAQSQSMTICWRCCVPSERRICASWLACLMARRSICR